MTNIQWEKEVDVIVLGSGGAALSAAVSAADNGASVLILENTPNRWNNGLLWRDSLGAVKSLHERSRL